MRFKVGFSSLGLLTVMVVAGCGHGTVIGSAPTPTPTPNAVGVSKEIPNPGSGAQPVDLALGSDGNLYITNFGASSLNQFNTTTDVFTRFLPKTPNSAPLGIAIGPDNNMWFTESAGNHIATLSLNTISEFPLPAGAAPAYITAGPASALYFTEPGLNAIGSISVTTQVAAGPFLIPTANAGPLSIIGSPDNTVWFTEHTAGKLGRFNPQTSKVDEEVALAPGSAPTDIRVGPDAALWFTENIAGAPKLGRVVPATGSVNEYPLTGAASATALTLGLDNNFYFADPANNAIASFNISTLKVAEYKIPTANSNPTGMAVGTDGKIYFTEQTANQIGQFTYF